MSYCNACLAATARDARYCPSCGAAQVPTAAGGSPSGHERFDFGASSYGDPLLSPAPMQTPESAARSAATSVAMWSHLAPLIMWGVALLLGATGVGILIGCLCWIPPLIMRNSTTGKRSQFARVHATESLNLQLTFLVISGGYIAVVLLGLGILFAGSLTGYGVIWLVVIVGIALCVLGVVQMIMGAVKGHGGEYFRYWINFRMVKP